jgi:hypothetical protein
VDVDRDGPSCRLGVETIKKHGGVVHECIDANTRIPHLRCGALDTGGVGDIELKGLDVPRHPKPTRRLVCVLDTPGRQDDVKRRITDGELTAGLVSESAIGAGD